MDCGALFGKERMKGMKKNLINIVLIAVFCAVAAWQFFGLHTPFAVLEAEEVASVEISAKGGTTVTLDEAYARQVVDVVSSIRLCGKRGSDGMSGWNDGSVTKMFTLVFADGTRVTVGDNFPEFVMGGLRYCTAISAQKYLDQLQAMYFDHPDHCPIG